MKRWQIPAMLSLAMLMAGCENNAASYQVDGSKDHAISLLREQNVPWGLVTQRFVVSRFPDCQRRYDVESTSTDMVKISLYQVAPMLFAAQQGQNWYALGTEACQVQTFKPEDRPSQPPGNLLGSFEKQDGKLVFIPAK